MKNGAYFDEEDFACPCCGRIPLLFKPLIELLDDMSTHCGKKLKIIGGYRCERHNSIIGAPEQNLYRTNPLMAAEIDATELGVEALATVAEQFGADGVGRCHTKHSVQLDVRDGSVDGQHRWQD